MFRYRSQGQAAKGIIVNKIKPNPQKPFVVVQKFRIAERLSNIYNNKKTILRPAVPYKQLCNCALRNTNQSRSLLSIIHT